MVDLTIGGARGAGGLDPTSDSQNSGTPNADSDNPNADGAQGAQGGQNNNGDQGDADPTPPAQTSVWAQFLENLPDADPNFQNPLLLVPGTLRTSAEATRYNTYVNSVLVDPATTVTDDQLPENYTNPTPSQFLSWHQAVQLRYLSEHVNQADLAAGRATIGTGNDRLGVVLADSGREVIIVNRLSRTTIASLSQAEQQRVATSPVFESLLALPLGLLPNEQFDLAASRTLLRSDIDAKIREIENKHPDFKPREPYNTDKEVFIDQLKLIRDSIDDASIFSRSDIAGRVGQIMERFERLFRYYDVRTNRLVPGVGPRDFLTTDNNASINRAYSVLIDQERRIYAIEQSTRQMLEQQGLSSTDSEGNTVITYLDVPTLVAFIQNNQGLKTQAIIAMRTEQLTQLNTLSQAYSEMQRLVNETLKQFVKTGTDANDEKHHLHVNFGAASEFTRTVIRMFDSTSGVSGHPVERDFSATRPLQNLGVGDGTNPNVQYTRTQWERFSTQLSDAVTLLNPQLLTNDINQDNRERTRSTEQASNTVRRQYELVSGIARAFT